MDVPVSTIRDLIPSTLPDLSPPSFNRKRLRVPKIIDGTEVLDGPGDENEGNPGRVCQVRMACGLVNVSGEDTGLKEGHLPLGEVPRTGIRGDGSPPGKPLRKWSPSESWGRRGDDNEE